MKQVKDYGQHEYNDYDFTKHEFFLNDDHSGHYTNSIMRKQPNQFWFNFQLPLLGQRVICLNGLLVLLLLSLEYVLISLGLWQLERADEKQQLQQQMELQHSTTAIDISDNLELVMDYQLVTFAGTPVPKLTVYVANEPHQGQDGYHILNLIELSNNQLVWVNRGWIKALPDRRYLPEVSPLPEFWSAHGTAYYSKGEPVLFEHALSETTQNQWVIQALSFKLLSQVGSTRNRDVLPYIIRLAPDASHGFVREWQWLSMSPEKHIAYAIQWFGLAIALLILGGFVSIRKQSEQ